jgi:C4-dicarboxylate transporter DctQ subunit
MITFLMGAATVIIFVAVVHRYLAGLPIPGLQDWLMSLNFGWAQELCIIMFVWMAKFGAAYGVRTGIHVGVDVLINRLPPVHAQVRPLRPAGRRAVHRHRRHAGRAFVWENGAHYASFHAGLELGDLPEGPTTPDLEWPTWIVYAVHAGGLVR